MASIGVPLEPYPAPPLQAMGQEGYEYPPRVVPSAENFEAMVGRLNLKRRWDGGRGGGGSLGAKTKSPTAVAEKDLASSLQNIEDAMRDLLIVADLVHVARDERSFIGQESLTESQLPGDDALPLPVSYIAPEIVLEMKKNSLAQAANDMATWVQQMQATVNKSRRLVGTVAGLRHTTRLRAGGRNMALARPLSAGDPLSVLIDTKKGPLILPFRINSDGIPHVLGQGEKARQDLLGMMPAPTASSSLHVYVFGRQRGSYACSSSRQSLPTQKAENSAGLAHSLQELDDEAYMGRLFEFFRREVTNPAQAWVDRCGVCKGSDRANLDTRQAVKAIGEEDGENKEVFGRVHAIDMALQVAEATGQHIVVEIDNYHRLAIEFGAGKIARQPSLSSPQAASLQRLSELAYMRLIELGMLQGRKDSRQEEKGDEQIEEHWGDVLDHTILLRVAKELAHHQFIESLLSRLSRILRKVRKSTVPTVVETLQWVEYPFTVPISQLVVIGRSQEAKSFLLDIQVRTTSLRVSWTSSNGDGKGDRTSTITEELAGLEDLEMYLERKLSLRQLPGTF